MLHLCGHGCKPSGWKRQVSVTLTESKTGLAGLICSPERAVRSHHEASRPVRDLHACREGGRAAATSWPRSPSRASGCTARSGAPTLHTCPSRHTVTPPMRREARKAARARRPVAWARGRAACSRGVAQCAATGAPLAAPTGRLAESAADKALGGARDAIALSLKENGGREGARVRHLRPGKHAVLRAPPSAALMLGGDASGSCEGLQARV